MTSVETFLQRRKTSQTERNRAGCVGFSGRFQSSESGRCFVVVKSCHRNNAEGVRLKNGKVAAI